MLNKPGRNTPCPCGSGHKFKRCHGTLDSDHAALRGNTERMQAELRVVLSRHEAKEFQRQEQQGLGKSIISTEFQDHRLVAVGNALHASKEWRTFHDFLSDYPKIVLGEDWWMSEVSKPPDHRHRILTWAVRSAEHAKAHAAQFGVGAAQPMTGAISAYMRFAYDLYSLKHAVEV